ncbi:MAG: AsmA family protein, partial [Gammaproteobacteria bacterium]|nr:AsmA family protein [Gammaproteobacteria bacterium]
MKKFLISVVVVLLLAILSIAGFIYTFDANKYKNEVAEAVSEIVGRQVEILGDVDISIYPWIGVTLNNLTIENNTDFSNKSFA